MDMSALLKQNWQHQHPEEYVNRLLEKKDFPGLAEAMAIHPSEYVNRAALSAISQLDFTELHPEEVDLLDQAVKRAIKKPAKVFSTVFVDAANIIAKIKRPAGIGELISLLDKDQYLGCDMKVQSAFEVCCGAIGDQGIDVILTHLLEHNDRTVEKMLVSGLGSIGGERAYDALILGLQRHCEKSWANSLWDCLTIDSYIYYLNRIGLKPNALETLKVALDLTSKKYEERMAHLDRPLLGNTPEPALIKKLEELIQNIQP